MERKRCYWILGAAAFGAAALFLASTPTPAQEKPSPAPTRVAVVDMSNVFDNYNRSKEAQNQLREFQQKVETKLKQMRDQIEALKAELDNFNPDSDDYLKRSEELLELTIKFDVSRRVESEKAARKMRTMCEEIYREITQAIQAAAEQSGYDLILYKDEVKIQKKDKLNVVREKILQRKVLYAHADIDLTEPVLRRLNQAYTLRDNRGTK